MFGEPLDSQNHGMLVMCQALRVHTYNIFSFSPPGSLQKVRADDQGVHISLLHGQCTVCCKDTV